jgi:RNA-directed DNA polymerase
MGKRGSAQGVSEAWFQIAFPEEASDGAGEAQADQAGASTGRPATGREGGAQRKWYTVIDKVWAEANLLAAWAKVRANGGAPGVDGQSVERFAQNVEQRLADLREDLRAGTYRPQPVRRVYLPKSGGGQRPLGIPTVRDRVVHQALRQVLEPIFEPHFCSRSHGFRPGRGCQSALKVVDQAVRHGYAWVVDADIAAFFDTVDHEQLLDAVHERVTDGSLLRLLRRLLTAGVLEPGERQARPTPLGTPQGSPLSPLLANLYLHVLDERLTRAGWGLVRYADDFVIFARSAAEATEALALAREVLEGQLGLTLHPDKTRVVAVTEGFEFLGYHWHWDEKESCWRKEVRRKSVHRFP